MRQNELLHEFVQIYPNHLDHASLLGIRPLREAKSVFDSLGFRPFCHVIPFQRLVPSGLWSGSSLQNAMRGCVRIETGLLHLVN